MTGDIRTSIVICLSRSLYRVHDYPTPPKRRRESQIKPDDHDYSACPPPHPDLFPIDLAWRLPYAIRFRFVTLLNLMGGVPKYK